ncbi:MAG: beta-lactamase family protein [Acidobacteriota bacterium]|nr:beta-lactamase family protein [Acidobacteriota bacterium]
MRPRLLLPVAGVICAGVALAALTLSAPIPASLATTAARSAASEAGAFAPGPAWNGPDADVDARLGALARSAAELPRLRSLLVSWQGELVLEHYFRGARADRPANIKSASKSVLSALVGVALAEGHLKDVSEPVAPHFQAELGPRADARTRGITVEHLLTMQTGLASTSGRNYGAWVQSPNWVRYVLRRPFIADPGTRMEYSTGNSHLLSALLTRVTHQSTWQFAQQGLARPLGFRLPRWSQDPQGVYFGGNDMLMTPRQMVAFGELYLNGGLVGERQLFPNDWVGRTFVPRGRSRWGSDREYGYGWWIRSLADRPTYYAWGYGGQFVFVVPASRMVIVTTSDPNVSRERREHLEGIYALAADIVAAVDPAAQRPR